MQVKLQPLCSITMKKLSSIKSHHNELPMLIHTEAHPNTKNLQNENLCKEQDIVYSSSAYQKRLGDPVY